MLNKCSLRVIEEQPCGCVVARCTNCGIYFSQHKCEFHHPVNGVVDAKEYYFDRMECIKNGIPQHNKISKELLTVLGELGVQIPEGHGLSTVLDIGAGIGIYAPLFMGYNYNYVACENDPFARAYIEGAYGAVVPEEPFESSRYVGDTFNAIVAAHVLEHLKDPKSMLIKMRNYLTIRGRLYLIVPDSTDLCNPDHLTFFNETGLVKVLEELGFVNIKSAQKQIVEREKFIYVVAEK